MADRKNSPKIGTDETTGLSRRRLLMSGGLATAGALAAAAAPRMAVAAAAPEIDTSFKDFTLPKFQCDDSLVKVQQKGELIVCTSNDWPYSYLAPKTNEWTGIDADIIRFVAKMLKIPKITVQTVPFDGMIPGLLDGRFDVVDGERAALPEAHRPGSAGRGFGLRLRGDPGLDKLRHRVLELLAALHRVHFHAAHEFIGQFEGRLHSPTFP